MGAFPHPAAYRLLTPRGPRSLHTSMSGSDQLKLPAVRTREDAAVGVPADRPSSAQETSRAVPMLWRVFAANAAVFALAFALLALGPLEIHARIRLIELVLLMAGLVVMLARRPGASAPGAERRSRGWRS